MKTNFEARLIAAALDGLKADQAETQMDKGKPDAELLAEAMDIIAGQRELIAKMQAEITRLRAENKRAGDNQAPHPQS